MPSLIPRFNWGTEVKNSNPTLYNQLSDSYSLTARIVNTKISKYVAENDPASVDQVNSILEEGDIWINRLTDTAWIMTSRVTNEEVTWKQIT